MPEAAFGGLQWRHVGPWQGGRVTAVSGVPGHPHRFYMGATGGGVWRSDNAGHTWRNLSDDFFGTTTIGAVAVAPSDANVIYVGTGESPIRGVTTSHGDGVYKSTDGGETWSHLGLEATRQISSIVVHPTDPDLLWLAAQGNPWGPNPERGVYRSEDGGLTWDPVLQKNSDTGAVDLVLDAQNPRVLFAALWDHRRSPWFVRSGGEGSGLYKSVDGGETWNELTEGLPELMGKIGVAVSPADPRRIYALVEAEEGGLYRSDDGGESWSRINDSRVIQARSWYYQHVATDPGDAETVWVLNVPLLKSIDGGVTFEAVETPHGDHHDLWFNPESSLTMVLGTDGGATVSLDGGETWSPLDNQPTAQMYRVSTDDRFPYWIYGGQQDWSTVAIPSRGEGGGIRSGRTHGVGGGESAHVAFDARDPQLVYATSINGSLTEYDARTGLSTPIRPYPEYVFGRDGADQRYRANWNAPVLVSRHDPSVIYYATQMVLASQDRGRSWRELSGDLTRDEAEKQGRSGGPITNEQAGAELYNTIFALAESIHDPEVLWVGSDDGLVHLTRDGGASWRNVTPEGLPEAQVNAIEPSPHDPAGAYLAVAGYKSNDFRPLIYATDDFGASWRLLVEGLPIDTFVRVVREDPERPGLLYAGTETGVFTSFDGGGFWQPLQLNLPEVPITDLALRQGDLVAATQGRGFWVLDDLSPLHRLDDAVAERAVFLFPPRPAYRLGSGPGRSLRPSGENPPSGAILYYLLSEEAVPEEPGAVSLEILDAEGATVRRFVSEETEEDRCQLDNTEARSRRPLKVLPAEKGLNRWSWDLRRAPLRCIEQHRLFRGFAGPRVAPGAYRVRLTVGKDSVEQPLTILPDPRRTVEPGAFAEQDGLLRRAIALFDRLVASLDAMRQVREQIEDRLARIEGSDAGRRLAEVADPLLERIVTWESKVVQPRHETYDDDINWPNMLDVQVGFLISEMDAAEPPVSVGARRRLEDLEATWQNLEPECEAILGDGVSAFDSVLDEAEALGLVVPDF